jgi:hypothetical protein
MPKLNHKSSLLEVFCELIHTRLQTQVKERVEQYLYSPTCLHGMDWDNFTFTFLISDTCDFMN